MSDPLDPWLENFWAKKRDQFLLDNLEVDPIHLIQNDKKGVFYEDNLSWEVYKVDKLSPKWKWDVPDEYWMSNNSYARPMQLAICTALFHQRKQISNPICISVNDDYWLHPGTHRYFLNRVCHDFDLPAVIIDTSGKYNRKRIYHDFEGVENYHGALDITYKRPPAGNKFNIKPVTVLSDESYYKLEYDSIIKIFNLDYAIDLWYNDKHYMTVTNGKPKKSFRIKGIEGLAQVAVHELCDPDYKFEELYYESI